MQYPLISEYVQAIRDAKDNLDKLSYLEPVLDIHGDPLHSSGAFAVVFKMKDGITGKMYALKCFTEEQKGRKDAYDKITEELAHVDSTYIISVSYFEKELFVDSTCTSETEFPVLLMEWIEGMTMEAYIKNNYDKQNKMKWLTYRFCKMSGWLHSQQFAHGDIKPDNIMVKKNGTLVLIDYDGMYVPSMKGLKSPTLGSRDYSHPLRTPSDFNETIDDFSLTSISLSLKLISLDADLYTQYGSSDGMLLRKSDYHNLSNSKILAIIHEYITDQEVCTLYGNFLQAYAQKDLALHSFRNFIISRP
ncbi:MAG: protein kinase [Bacteroidaceae bacterium]|nr:protein kinase [Bacteroidaceae bacterium]